MDTTITPAEYDDYATDVLGASWWEYQHDLYWDKGDPEVYEEEVAA